MIEQLNDFVGNLIAGFLIGVNFTVFEIFFSLFLVYSCGFCLLILNFLIVFFMFIFERRRKNKYMDK